MRGQRILIVAFCCALAGCRNVPTHDSQKAIATLQGTDGQSVVAAQNRLGFELLDAMSDGRSNTLLSPYSAFAALGLLYYGSGGETKRLMEKSLHLPDLSPELWDAANESLSVAFRGVEPAEILVANSLWANRRTLKTAYVERCSRAFGANLQSISFDARGLNQINEWARGATRGKVSKIMDGFSGPTFAVLASAVYFKAKWKDEFDPGDTRVSEFFREDGATVQAAYMQRKGSYRYFQDKRFQMLEIPYRGVRLAMFFVLPEKGAKVHELLTEIRNRGWGTVAGRLSAPTEGLAVIPKARLESRTDLREPLTKLGLGSLFQLADLRAMAAEEDRVLYVGSAATANYLDIDEEGTEAAAATQVEVVEKAVDGPMFEFLADHPFLYGIWDCKTKAILFLGILMEPNPPGE